MAFSAAGLQALQRLSPLGWFLSITLVTLAQALLLLRWWCYLAWLKHPISPCTALSIYVQGWSLLLTPARSGEGVRVLSLQQRCGVPVSVGLAVLLAERITGLAAALLLSLLALSQSHAGALFVGLILVGAGLWLVTHPRLIEGLAGRLAWRPWQHGIKVISQMRHLLHPRALGLGLALAMLAWVLESVLLANLWHALAALPFSPSLLRAALLARVGMGISGVLSMLPAGIGVADSAGVGLALIAGLPFMDAVLATAILRLLTLIVPMALGWLALAAFHWHRYSRI